MCSNTQNNRYKATENHWNMVNLPENQIFIANS
jgi:hypothetical protein